MVFYHLIVVLSVVAVASAALSTADCGRLKTCFRGKANCQNTNDCSTLIMYQVMQSQGLVRVEAGFKTAEAKFIGLGINPTHAKMKDTIGFVCAILNSTKGAHWVVQTPDHVRPDWDQYRTLAELTNVVVAYTNGAIECSFTRRLNMTFPSHNFLNVPYYVSLLYGTKLTARDTPEQHTKVYASKQKFTFTDQKLDVVLPFLSGANSVTVVPCFLVSMVMVVLTMLLW